jgi:hypothetical protein
MVSGYLQLLHPILAAEGDIEYFPLPYQIICIVLTGLFLWTFSIARDPRSWRRLYQAKFSKADDFSVNKNKKLDENLKKWGISVSMFILVFDVFFFVWGLTYQMRMRKHERTTKEATYGEDVSRVNSSAGLDGARRKVGG